MTLSDLSIKKPVFAWMVMVSLLLFGAVAFSRLGISQNPDIDFPIVNVALTWEGAAPEVMENEVVDPIEEAVMSVEGIKKVASSTRYGSANVTIEFELSKDIDVAVQEIQTKITQTKAFLPKDLNPAIIQKMNPEDQPILWLGVSADKPYREVVQYVRDHLKDRFQTVPGVGEVFLGGFVEPNMRVWLKPQAMQYYQLTVDDVVHSLESQHTELPAGILKTALTERNVRVMGEAQTVEDFNQLTVPQVLGQGMLWRTIQLQDIARVEEGLADARAITRVNGKTAVGIGIRKQRGANAVQVAQSIKKMLPAISKDLPQTMEIGVNFDSTVFIEENIHELVMTLILAVIFTSLVCWLFLGSFSSTLNVFLSIPTALGGTFMVIYFLGFTLNTVTLLAISLVIGIVVDDAIVVLENIVRHRENGESQIKAAVFGAREITFSIIVISSAVMAIFLPVAFMKGIIGKFFYQFGVTISVAVAFSLLEAVTLAPMRCSQFLETGHDTRMGRSMDSLMKKMSALYQRTLAWCLNYRWIVLIFSLIFFVASLGIAKFLRSEMTPAQDQGLFLIRIQTPSGSSLEYTDNVIKEAEKFLLARGEVNRYYAAIGGFGGGEVDTGMIFVTMKNPKQRPIISDKKRALNQTEFMQVSRETFAKIKGAERVYIQDFSQGIAAGAGQRGFPIELSLRGANWDTLGSLAETLRTKLLDSGLAVDVGTSYRVGVPEVRVVPDRKKAAAMGVTTQAIARAINASIGGVRAGKYTTGGRRYDVRVSLEDSQRESVQNIKDLYVRNIRGEIVPLSSVTKILEKPALLTIQRENRERAVSIFGNVANGKSQAQALQEAQKIAKEILPEGYRLVVSGSAQQFQETFQELLFALILGIAIAYMILAAQFNSFIHPFTVLLALPFSLSGAFAGLWITNQSLNMMSMIGILLLMGIVKKTSILLVDFTNVKREEGMLVDQALLHACPLRLRPILMTSLTVIAGALPSALSLGPGAELRLPMGVSIIGGTIISTLLTLYVVPCSYSVMARFEPKNKQARAQEVHAVLSEK